LTHADVSRLNDYLDNPDPATPLCGPAGFKGAGLKITDISVIFKPGYPPGIPFRFLKEEYE
jgi:hypothetical protein